MKTTNARRLQRTGIILTLFVYPLLMLFPVRALAADHPQNAPWLIGPKLGFSNFTGVIGLEAQHQHFALDVGYFPAGGVRYYFRPAGHSWFAGLFGSGSGYDHDETRDGIAYTHYSMIQGGVGGGYRWLWRQRWSLELGMTVGYEERHWTNSYGTLTETGIGLGPVADFGISF